MPGLGLRLQCRDRHAAASTYAHWILMSEGASVDLPLPAGGGELLYPIGSVELTVGSTLK